MRQVYDDRPNSPYIVSMNKTSATTQKNGYNTWILNGQFPKSMPARPGRVSAH